MDYQYQGIVIGKKDVAEADRFYTIYTREAGKIRVLGKGVRNASAKLAGNLEPITLGEIDIARSRGMGKVTGVIAVNNFLGIKSNYQALSKIFDSFRIFDKIVTEQEKDENIFNLLLEYLETMEKISSEENEKKLNLISAGFLFKLLDSSGYKLNMNKCFICGKKLSPGGNFFSAQSGGVTCCGGKAREEKKMSINDETIKLVRLFLSNKMKNLEKIAVSPEGVENSGVVAGSAVKWLIE